MKIAAIAAALVAGFLWLAPASASAQDPVDDALDLLQTDPVAALVVLEGLVAAGDVEAMNAVAAIIENPPEGIPEDPMRAMHLWEQAVAGGSRAAELNLATRLMLNDDPADDARAVGMLSQVPEEFTSLAAYPLGRAYMFGSGVEQNLTRGSRLMEIAVEAAPGNIDARFLLGRAYQNGWGIPVDHAAAYRHMKVAADGDDARAQWYVGMMLLEGRGVTANPALAHAYVRASAEGDYVSGMISLAVMLAVGQGVEPDPAQARQWYRRAAEAGSAHALRGLAGMLLNGEGGRIDTVTGAAYLDLAAKAGDSNAQRLQQMLAPTIAEADRGAIEAVKAAWLRQYGVPH